MEHMTLFYFDRHGVRRHVKVKYLDEAITIVAWELRRHGLPTMREPTLSDSEGNVIMDTLILHIRACQYNEDNNL